MNISNKITMHISLSVKRNSKTNYKTYNINGSQNYGILKYKLIFKFNVTNL